MKLSLIASVLCALVFPQLSFADGDALSACVDIYKNSIRDYSEQQHTNVELARSYNSFCKRDGSVNTSATGIGLEAVIKTIPFKFSLNSTSDQQKMEEFCKVGSTQYDSWDTGSAATSTVATDALTNFNNCVDLANAGIHLRVSISQPETLVVSGDASASYNGFLNSVAYDNAAMTCRSADLNGSHSSVILKGPVHIALNSTNPFAITCTKIGRKLASGSTYYNRATLTLAVTSASPLAIIFPSDSLNGYELASEANLAVSQAALKENEARAETVAEKQIAESLQNRINGVSVEVHTWDLGMHNCYGTPSNWGAGFDAESNSVCGGRPRGTAVGNLRPGGSCGQAATAYACVNIPN